MAIRGLNEKCLKQLGRFRYWVIHHYPKVAPYFYPIFFLIHCYPIALFKPIHIKRNFKILITYRKEDVIYCDRHGNFYVLKSPWKKFCYEVLNTLTLNAFGVRYQKALYCTLVAFNLEYMNPVTRSVTVDFLERKVALFRRICERLPLSKRNQIDLDVCLSLYLKGSYLALHLTNKIHKAVHRQRDEPILQEAEAGLDAGMFPRLTIVGAGGSYFMRSPGGDNVGIFKPFDEELGAPNNPFGPLFRDSLGSRGARRGCRVGEACHHEVAAYLVDQFFGLGIVPKTHYASFTHFAFSDVRVDLAGGQTKPKTKYGSFQAYVEGFIPFHKAKHDLLASLSLEETQSLIILDVLIGNLDRNVGNILVGDGELVAVDHGLSFPDMVTIEMVTWFWEVAPWGTRFFAGPLVDLIMDFSLDDLSHKLHRKCLLEDDQISRMRERVALLRAGVRAKLVPFHLSKLLTYSNLLELTDLGKTLDQRAFEVVENYLNYIKKWPWAKLRY